MLNLKSNSYVSGFLKKLSVSDSCVLSVLKAACSHTYVETLGNKADALHYHAGRSYPEVLCDEFFEQAKSRIRHLVLGVVNLVADITEENFYGNTSGLFIHGWTGEREC